MKKYALSLWLCLLFSSKAFGASVHVNKYVETIHSPDERQCTFVVLKDVPVADPTVSTSEWMAIPLNHPGHNVILNIMLTAYVSNKPVTLRTTGNLACGLPEVKHVLFHYG